MGSARSGEPTRSRADFGVEDWQREWERSQEYFVIMQKLVARAWLDTGYEQQLMENPTQALREAGIPIPPGLVIRPEQISLPPRPAEISDEQLVVPTAERAGAGGETEMANISCAGSASSFSCPCCTAACAGSGGCLVEEG